MDAQPGNVDSMNSIDAINAALAREREQALTAATAHSKVNGQFISGPGGGVDASKMTRSQAVEHLRSNGYTGPVSYGMPKLRQLAAEHSASRAPAAPSAPKPAAPADTPRAKQEIKWQEGRARIEARHAQQDREARFVPGLSPMQRRERDERIAAGRAAELERWDRENKPAANPVRPESWRDRRRVEADMEEHIRDSNNAGYTADQSMIQRGLRDAQANGDKTVDLKLDYEMSIPIDLAQDAVAHGGSFYAPPSFNDN